MVHQNFPENKLIFTTTLEEIYFHKAIQKPYQKLRSRDLFLWHAQNL